MDSDATRMVLLDLRRRVAEVTRATRIAMVSLAEVEENIEEVMPDVPPETAKRLEAIRACVSTSRKIIGRAFDQLLNDTQPMEPVENPEETVRKARP